MKGSRRCRTQACGSSLPRLRWHFSDARQEGCAPSHLTRRGGLRDYVLLLASDIVELLLSVFLFPVRAAFHARFILNMSCGKPVAWAPTPRASDKPSLVESFRACHTPLLLGFAIAVLATGTGATTPWWRVPIAPPMIIAPVFVAITSRTELGEALRRLGLLRVPHELALPEALVDCHARSAATDVLPARQAHHA